MEVVDYSNLPKYDFFPDVLARVLLSGKHMTFFMIEIPVGKEVPLHKHPHEQMGICLAGQSEFTCGSEKRIVSKGMAYRIGPNEEHSITITGSENGLFMDVFSPPRLEYVFMQESFEKRELRRT
jgi:quercetin dioxygenase-like cupin family protein